MKTKYIASIIILVLGLTAFSGCSLLKKRVEKTEKVEYKISAVNKTRISIEDDNGEIKITRTNDTLGMVIIEAEKSYDVRYDEQDKPLENVKINIDTADSEIKIVTEIIRNNGMFRNHRGGEVNYNIKIPAKMQVSIDNTNGDIMLVGIDSEIDIETVNSAINLVNCTGMIKIDGVNGGVYGNFDSTKGINIELVNGMVKLGGMKNVSANVNASTINGRVKFNNLEFTDVVSEKKSLTGKLGTGGSNIVISTVNGSITLDAQQVSYKKDSDFNFKIDFDDDGDLDIHERKDDSDDDEGNNRRGNQIDTNIKDKITDTIENRKEKKIDTVKKK
jgi:hypothetical protein